MKKWIKRSVVADKLGVSYNFLRNDLEPSEDFPKAVPLSPKIIVFDEGQIDAWMKMKEQQFHPQPVNI